MEVNKTNSGIPKFLQVKYAAALNRKRTRCVTVKCVCVFLGGFINVGVVGGGRGYGFGEAAVNSMAQACFWPTRLVPAALSSPFMAVCVSFFPARQLFTFGLF